MAKLTFTKQTDVQAKNTMQVFSKARDTQFIKEHSHYRYGFFISISVNVLLIIYLISQLKF